MTHCSSRAIENLTGLKVGNYVLQRVLGRGRMGVVYLAEDAALLRPTAVKLLAWDFSHNFGEDPIEWFLDEARHVAKINHPRVVQIYAAARQGDQCYIAMELVDGPSAEALVDSEGPLSVERATGVLIDVASALQAAHEAGVVHRDVKPANILVSRTQQVAKLGDFGMALSTRSLSEGRGRVRAGTPYYTAPELWLGAVASPSSDVYSLGATYYYLLTGKPPFPSCSTSDLRELHIAAQAPDPRQTQPNLPEEAAQLVQRTLAKNPRARFDSASDVALEGKSILRSIAANLRTSRSEEGPESWTEAYSVRGYDPPSDVLESLQFLRQPFSTRYLQSLPYVDQPFSGLVRRLESDLSTKPRRAMLVGAQGTGRSTLLEQLVGRLQATRRVSWIHQPAQAEAGHLTRQLGMALGDGHTPLAGLLKRLAAHQARASHTHNAPVIVVDEASVATFAELQEVLSIGGARGGFSIVVCSRPGLREKLLPLVEDEHVLTPLNAMQSARYVQAWMRATRPATAPPLLFSPDAQLILAARSGGVLPCLHRLVLNALTLVAVQHRRVVTSFEAWSASTEEDWVRGDGTLRSQLPPRPEAWPPPRVCDAIQALRAGHQLRTDTLSPNPSKRRTHV